MYFVILCKTRYKNQSAPALSSEFLFHYIFNRKPTSLLTLQCMNQFRSSFTSLAANIYVNVANVKIIKQNYQNFRCGRFHFVCFCLRCKTSQRHIFFFCPQLQCARGKQITLTKFCVLYFTPGFFYPTLNRCQMSGIFSCQMLHFDAEDAWEIERYLPFYRHLPARGDFPLHFAPCQMGCT